MKKFLGAIVLLLSINATAQNSDTFKSLSLSQEHTIKYRTYSEAVGKKYNSKEYYDHPDFGILPQGSPLGNMVEDLSKRTVDSRYFIDVDNPTFCYIYKSSVPVNFYSDGHLLEIDPSLKQVGSTVFKATKQPIPTELNTATQYSSILEEKLFSFNHFELSVVNNDNTEQLYIADWSDLTVTGKECYIRNIFPGIDMRMEYKEGSVKSDFIIRQNPGVKKLYFIDNLEMSSSLDPVLEKETNELGGSKTQLLIYDKATRQKQFEIQTARTHDASGRKQGWVNEYSFANNKLSILCDSFILNDPKTVYPVVVDPLVVAGPVTLGATYTAGSLVTPSSCPATINITIPTSVTPVDVSASWSVYANFCFGYYTGHGSLSDDCWQSEALIYVTSPCASGRSPSTGTWNCAGCNSTGNWNSNFAFGTSGSQSLVQCNTAACSSQNLNFTINLGRANCNSYLNYDGCTPVARSYCMTLDYWSLTVRGRTMETLSNTTTGNGSLATIATCNNNFVMNPSATYGVTPYSYVWNTGGTSATKTITPVLPGTTANHTVTVTDACGTSRTAGFAITNDCPLPVELLSFSGKKQDQNILLQWTTASEINSDYFLIERNIDGVTFLPVSKIEASGNSGTLQQYQFVDLVKEANTYYYRLKQVDFDGSSYYSRIIAVQTGIYFSGIQCVPNPAAEEVKIILPGNLSEQGEEIRIDVYTLQGIRCLFYESILREELFLNLKILPPGTFVIRAYNEKGLLGSTTIVHQ